MGGGDKTCVRKEKSLEVFLKYYFRKITILPLTLVNRNYHTKIPI